MTALFSQAQIEQLIPLEHAVIPGKRRSPQGAHNSSGCLVNSIFMRRGAPWDREFCCKFLRIGGTIHSCMRCRLAIAGASLPAALIVSAVFVALTVTLVCLVTPFQLVRVSIQYVILCPMMSERSVCI